jgi:long-subunit acyl-CoA synthetase (AMP-forming)
MGSSTAGYVLLDDVGPSDQTADVRLEVPDSIPICEFYSNEDYGRRPLATSRAPYTCGITGLSYSAFEVRDRTAALSRALAKRLEFAPNKGTEWDKVVCLFSANSIDYITACHAVHRLSGIVTPASAAYMVDELTSQLKASDSKAIFTCVKLLPVALEAARRHNVAEEKVFLFEMHDDPKRMPEKHTTVNQLIAEGRSLPELEPLKWSKGQGKRQTAFLSCSSGTSGLPVCLGNS